MQAKGFGAFLSALYLHGYCPKEDYASCANDNQLDEKLKTVPVVFQTSTQDSFSLKAILGLVRLEDAKGVIYGDVVAVKSELTIRLTHGLVLKSARHEPQRRVRVQYGVYGVRSQAPHGDEGPLGLRLGPPAQAYPVSAHFPPSILTR